jgi:Protein of unknown function (DUF4232)
MSPGWRATGLPRYCLRCDATVSRSCRIGIAGAVVAALVTPVLASTRADATTRSAAARSVPACGTRALVVTVSSNGAGGKVLIYVGLRNRGRHACLARGHAGLALRDAATHALLHVYGNPYGRAVHRSLRRGPNNLFTLQWQNYCGPGRPLLVVASFGRRQAIECDTYPGARCDLPEVPSELRLIHLPG